MAKSMCNQILYIDKGYTKAIGPALEITNLYQKETEARLEKDEAEKAEKNPQREDKEVLITKVTINGESKERPRIKSGEPLEIVIEIKTQKPLEKTEIRMSIIDNFGSIIWGMNSLSVLSEGRTIRIKETGIIKVKIDRVPLQGGKYSISAAVFEVGETLPKAETVQKHGFIIDTPPVVYNGTVYMPCKISHESF